MIKVIRICLAVLILTTTTAVGFVAHEMCRALDKLGVAADSISGIKNTLSTINRPCTDRNGCGTLAEIDKAVIDVKNIAVATHVQVEESGKLIEATTRNLDSVTVHINGTADLLSDVGISATRTLNQATSTEKQLQTSIANVDQQITINLDAVHTTVDAFDALLKSPTINNTMIHVDQTTGNIAGVTADTKRIADDMTATYFTKVPWWKQPGKWYRLAIDGATLAK